MKKTDLLGKRLVFVIAHPDDESFLAAGTIHQNYLAGGKNFIICATFGERGKSHVGDNITNYQLKKIRAKELRAVSKLLKVSKLIGLNLPDGSVENYHDKLSRGLQKHLPTLKADVIVTFGPDGVTGHKDHIAVGKAAGAFAKKHKIPIAQFVVSKKWHKSMIKRRKYGVYTKKLLSPKSNLTIAIDPKIKFKAIKAHVSQIDRKNPLGGYDNAVQKEMLSIEYFFIK